MLKQSELNPDEQAQVFARADALFREESEQAQNARAAAQAAEELGVPQEYLDRAAAQFHAEKVEKVRAQNQRKRVLMAVGLAAIPATLAIYLSTVLMQRQATVVPMTTRPVQTQAQLAPPFTLDLVQDAATTSIRDADVTFENFGNRYSFEIRSFSSGNGYQVNHGFSIPQPQPLNNYKRVSFTAKSQGISNVRVDLRQGQTRWNSRQISLSPQGQRVTLNFDELTRQVQNGSQWTRERGERPDDARALVFKFGAEINPPDTRGTVEISDVRFE